MWFGVDTYYISEMFTTLKQRFKWLVIIEFTEISGN